MTKSIAWKINNVHCDRSVKDIQDSLSKLTGVINVNSFIEVQKGVPSGFISVTYDDNQINTDILRKELRKITLSKIDDPAKQYNNNRICI